MPRELPLNIRSCCQMTAMFRLSRGLTTTQGSVSALAMYVSVSPGHSRKGLSWETRSVSMGRPRPASAAAGAPLSSTASAAAPLMIGSFLNSIHLVSPPDRSGDRRLQMPPSHVMAAPVM
ncbi:hypothetical protein ACFQZU_07025 [Streptomonospora algeriensis]|uniref:Uncharacterized protein n=1 Tax=Streptomonospora algeriensis TaxID=995084 RepID=A0ABW3BCX5_9ACTN